MNPTAPLNLNLKAKIRVNGKEYASAEEMPAKIREAYARAVGETAVLRSGARLATKLNAKIIFNGVEYDSANEMPVAERRLYQDALAAILPEPTVLSSDDAAKTRRRKLLLGLLVVSLIAVALFFGLNAFLR
jgi:hypothetical protein